MSNTDAASNALNPAGVDGPIGGRRPTEASPEASAFIDTFPAHVRLQKIENQQENRHRSWKWDCHPNNPRPQSPALPWHKEYSQLNPKVGRVLVIDFIRADQSRNRKRKVIAQEIDGLDGLRKLYTDPRRGADANLRLIHVQNAPWATKFLLRKFNIDGRDELVGSNFGRYAKSTKPERRGGKPFPNAKTWKVQHDPWRGISKTSFGFEYLKEYKVHDPSAEGRNFDEKLMELNGYDDEDNPTYSYDVYIQRLACYVQHKEDPPTPPFDRANGISNPYKAEPDGYSPRKKQRERLPVLSSLDNENAIILFDNSQSGSFEDCLIAARSEWETHWRRLPFYLAYEAREIVGNDDLLGRQCARMILDDVFQALVARWEIMIDTCQTHVSILEDRIYEEPALETRAPELWRNSSSWLQMGKLTTAHIAVVRDMRVRLRELVADIASAGTTGNSNNHPNTEIASVLNEDDWLEDIPTDFDRIASAVEEDLVKPTQALISLLYQSVSIRDSRLSLQIDASMWRLSWVSFIFLPLTFMVGFFGMNVDTFSNQPSLKWYFIVSVPFMLLVMVGWYVLKHILARQRQTPYQRGIYEAFFHDLAVSYPALWSRVGPHEQIVPRTRIDRLKWWLIKRWSRPERTIKAGQSNAETAAPSDLSTWSKFKRYLIRKWTGDIVSFRNKTAPGLLDVEEDTDLEQGSALMEGLVGATELLTVPGQPVASAALERWEIQRKMNRLVARPDQERYALQAASATAAEEGLTPRFLSPDIRLERVLGPSPGDGRAASSSPRGRRRPTSSGAGSSGSRNSGVLVEEEDPRWINQLAKEGRGGWYWKPGSPSPTGGGDRRRESSGSGGTMRPSFRRAIDERVGVGVGGGGGGDAASGGEIVPKPSSPLGTVMNIGNHSSDSPDDWHGHGLGLANENVLVEHHSSSSSKSTSGSADEAVRAAQETGGRENKEEAKEEQED